VILDQHESRERTAHLAAETINEYLATHPEKIDLVELGHQIRAVIA
jgi:hypothetical protein